MLIGADRYAAMAQIGIERALGNIEPVGDLLAAQFAFAIQCLRSAGSLFGTVRETFRTATCTASGPRRRESGISSLPDEIALELGKGSKTD